MAPSAGWFADPNDPAEMRWWDGRAWTEHVAPMPGEAQSRQRVATATALLEQDEPELEVTSSGYTEAELALYTGRTAAKTGTSPAAPGQFVWKDETARPPAGSTMTFGIVLVVLWPLEYAALLLLRATLAQNGLLPASLSLVSTVAVAAIGVVLLLSFASADRRLLAARGFTGLASPLWTLLPFGYQIARTVRLRGQGVKAGAAILVSVLLIGAGVAVPIVLGLGGLVASTVTGTGDASQQFMANAVGDRLQEQLAGQGHLFAKVTCPADTVSLAPNHAFTCTGVGGDGSSTVIAVSLDAQQRMTATLGATTGGTTAPSTGG